MAHSFAALCLVALACIGMANAADAGSTRRRNNRNRNNANAGIDKHDEQDQGQRELFHRLENEEIILGRGGVEKVIKLPTHANGGPKPKVDDPDDEEERSDSEEEEAPEVEDETSDEDPHDEGTHHD